MKKLQRVVKRDKLRDMINLSRGTFFTITFEKVDGTPRTMNCRTGVKKYEHGGKSPIEGIEKYISVYDVKSKGYRNVNLETATEIKIGGSTYKVI